MLTKARQQKLISGYSESAIEHLRLFCKKGQTEDLHRFRISIKKMRALIHLLMSYRSDVLPDNTFKPVIKIFRKTGHIRDLDVQLELLNHLPFDIPGFIANNYIKREKLFSKLSASIKNNQRCIKKEVNKIIKKIVDVDTSFIITNQNQLLHEVKRILKNNKADNPELHEARKKIKLVLYIHSFLPKKLQKKIPLNTTVLNKIQQEIGDWHDLLLLHEELSKDRLPILQLTKKVKEKRRGLKKLHANLKS